VWAFHWERRFAGVNGKDGLQLSGGAHRDRDRWSGRRVDGGKQRRYGIPVASATARGPADADESNGFGSATPKWVIRVSWRSTSASRGK
jgi:hypothetical protein